MGAGFFAPFDAERARRVARRAPWEDAWALPSSWMGQMR
jgi:hypothetical protein